MKLFFSNGGKLDFLPSPNFGASQKSSNPLGLAQLHHPFFYAFEQNEDRTSFSGAWFAWVAADAVPEGPSSQAGLYKLEVRKLPKGEKVEYFFLSVKRFTSLDQQWVAIEDKKWCVALAQRYQESEESWGEKETDLTVELKNQFLDMIKQENAWKQDQFDKFVSLDSYKKVLSQFKTVKNPSELSERHLSDLIAYLQTPMMSLLEAATTFEEYTQALSDILRGSERDKEGSASSASKDYSPKMLEAMQDLHNLLSLDSLKTLGLYTNFRDISTNCGDVRELIEAWIAVEAKYDRALLPIQQEFYSTPIKPVIPQQSLSDFESDGFTLLYPLWNDMSRVYTFDFYQTEHALVLALSLRSGSAKYDSLRNDLLVAIGQIDSIDENPLEPQLSAAIKALHRNWVITTPHFFSADTVVSQQVEHHLSEGMQDLTDINNILCGIDTDKKIPLLELAKVKTQLAQGITRREDFFSTVHSIESRGYRGDFSAPLIFFTELYMDRLPFFLKKEEEMLWLLSFFPPLLKERFIKTFAPGSWGWIGSTHGVVEKIFSGIDRALVLTIMRSSSVWRGSSLTPEDLYFICLTLDQETRKKFFSEKRHTIIPLLNDWKRTKDLKLLAGELPELIQSREDLERIIEISPLFLDQAVPEWEQGLAQKIKEVVKSDYQINLILLYWDTKKIKFILARLGEQLKTLIPLQNVDPIITKSTGTEKEQDEAVFLFIKEGSIHGFWEQTKTIFEAICGASNDPSVSFFSDKLRQLHNNYNNTRQSKINWVHDVAARDLNLTWSDDAYWPLSQLTPLFEKISRTIAPLSSWSREFHSRDEVKEKGLLLCRLFNEVLALAPPARKAQMQAVQGAALFFNKFNEDGRDGRKRKDSEGGSEHRKVAAVFLHSTRTAASEATENAATPGGRG